MDNPRPEKVAVVDEVRTRLDAAGAAILTEYRGLTVADLAELRKALEAAGGDYKVYKNTLVRLATTGGRHEALHPLLEGPTAITFVTGEISAVAKALRDYARANPHLVIKGGMLGDGTLSASELSALADLPPREVLLARFAGGLAAPLQQLAGLLQALPRNLAYGLSALLDRRRSDEGDEGAPAPEAAAEAAPAAGAATDADAGAAEEGTDTDAGDSGEADTDSSAAESATDADTAVDADAGDSGEADTDSSAAESATDADTPADAASGEGESGDGEADSGEAGAPDSEPG